MNSCSSKCYRAALVLTSALLGVFLTTRDGSESAEISSSSTVVQSRKTVGKSEAFQIRVSNRGRSRLVLSQIDLGCDCSDRTLVTEILHSGASLIVELKHLQPPRISGANEERFAFTTSDPELPRFTAYVTGEPRRLQLRR
jgi:hypothetical protein